MMILITALALLSSPAQSRAENPPKAAPPTASGPILYELRDLKPNGISQFSAAGDIIRQYYEFQNAQGSHHVIYEEVPGMAGSRSAAGLKEIARAFDSRCSIDIECSNKAFCIGECRNMYYETSNAPGDAKAPERNNCKIVYFSCQPAGSGNTSLQSTSSSATTPPSASAAPAEQE